MIIVSGASQIEERVHIDGVFQVCFVEVAVFEPVCDSVDVVGYFV